MLTYFVPEASALARYSGEERKGPLPRTATWVDLESPTDREIARVEAMTGVQLPTRQQMTEIESSSRFYQDDEALVMTASLVRVVDNGQPAIAPVTFILRKDRLVTLRFEGPRAFEMVAAKVQRAHANCQSGSSVLFELLNTAVDRTADIQEVVASRLEEIARTIFETGVRDRRDDPDMNSAIKSIGRLGILTLRIQDSLMSLERMAAFLGHHVGTAGISPEDQGKLDTIHRDVRSLTEHADALDSKANFLLDATLGLVSLHQNQIAQIFSVMAVLFLPPTLIASSYGMNFQDMPTLDWRLGFPFSIILMVVSAIACWAVFRWRRWL
ncbi:magnesium transporter CorA family protein [Amorphus orientalis]|uniref:Magnesium transport protein CorA n=1 Tax=Amorphus orientalis TaxID=649198 RepID=A0AAE4AW34_9HYPH|nr:magnesium transporter CorA family protein [Amorphus orientalis]MDQ0317339.1 magnesium transporter [Amorphus orientalis]